MVCCCLCDDDFSTVTCLLHDDDALGKVGEMSCFTENRHEVQTHHLHLKCIPRLAKQSPEMGLHNSFHDPGILFRTSGCVY